MNESMAVCWMKMIVTKSTFQKEQSGMDIRGLGFLQDTLETDFALKLLKVFFCDCKLL